MCGFAGVVVWDERYRVSPATLRRMSAAVAHRGPDGEGIHLSREHAPIAPDQPQVALAFRRLAILDPEERSMQPFTDGRRWLVFNGEIYNFRELRAELTTLLPDYQWRTTGDTEVLLAAYAAWGPQCVRRLNGMFAFAVWDEQERTLFLARDRMGQKPMYVAARPRDGSPLNTPFDCDAPLSAIAIASELPALLALPWVDRTLCPDALALYLSLGYIPDRTICCGAAKLQPASTATVSADRARSADYYQSFKSFGTAGITDAQAVAATRRLFTAAVERQLVADVPVGCFLSGGVDSSVTAAGMRAAVPPSRPVLTFSAGFGDARYDERPFAAVVAAHLGTTHVSFEITPDVAADLPALAAVCGEPFADSSILPTYWLARRAREHVTVALSGDGGDELFGGYDRYRAMALTDRLGRLPATARRALSLAAAAVPGSAHPKGRPARLRRLLASVEQPAAQRYAGYVALFDPPTIAALTGWPLPAAGATFAGVDRMFAVGAAARPSVPNALAVDRLTYLPEDLHTKVDRASMLCNLEVRSPFMDPDVVAFAAGLTTDQLLKGGPKRMLREAFADDLPAWVFRRKKMGFAVPVGDWFRGPLRPMLRDTLFAAHAFGRAHFDMAVVQRLVDDHESGRVDHGQRLYALLMLELWWNTARPPA